MLGSLTTPGRAATRADAADRVAFRLGNAVGTRDKSAFAAQWPACTLPCRRFAVSLTGADARLGASVGRYAFTVEDFHLRGCTQISSCRFSDLAAGRRKIVAARTVRGESAVLKMPAEDIGPTWGDWSDAASCVDFNTNTSVISRTDSYSLPVSRRTTNPIKD
jgi:hypothetical protein